MKKFFLVFGLLFCFNFAHSQVLLSLIFGDKLNSPRLEFGLEGGVNFATISNTEGAEIGSNFNLGFYFDYKLKNPQWIFSTGVIVKSKMGANGLPVYSLNNEDLDAVFVGGFVDRDLEYFNVPLLMKYEFQNHIYVKAGTMLGLLYKATDNFQNYVDDQKIEYANNFRDETQRIDAGLAVGAGYRITKGNGMNIGMMYYNSFVPVMKGNINQYNQTLYLTVGIPIGKGKAAKEAAAKKEAAEKATEENKTLVPATTK